MERGPITEDEIKSLDEIQDLCERIYVIAAPLDKYPRHPISDAANLIRWIAFDYHKPGDPEAVEAINKLRSALSRTNA